MSSILLEILKTSKLNLTDMTLQIGAGTNVDEKLFEITPKDFLRFAKEDFSDGEERGYINSLTNAKRAIDCQIDETIESLISKSDNFNPIIGDFLKHFDIDSEIPIKLKIIHALNLAPSLLISKSRSLRNKLEHAYKKPESHEVREALDVAELFISSVAGKLRSVWTEFELVDWKDNVLRFYYENKSFLVEYKKDEEVVQSYVITPNMKEYYGLLRLMLNNEDEFEINKTFKILLTQINHPIPLDKVQLWHSWG